jgi:hypothetical protein
VRTAAIARVLRRRRADARKIAFDPVGLRPGDEDGAERGPQREPLPRLHVDAERPRGPAPREDHDLIVDRRGGDAVETELVGERLHLRHRGVDDREAPDRGVAERHEGRSEPVRLGVGLAHEISRFRQRAKDRVQRGLVQREVSRDLRQREAVVGVSGEIVQHRHGAFDGGSAPSH